MISLLDSLDTKIKIGSFVSEIGHGYLYTYRVSKVDKDILYIDRYYFNDKDEYKAFEYSANHTAFEINKFQIAPLDIVNEVRFL
jgi:hypothetical protein